jgi:hypothetical protein
VNRPTLLRSLRASLAFAALVLAGVAATRAAEISTGDLKALSVEDLMNIAVTSVSKTADLALAGANLLHAHHQEFTVPPAEAVTRSAMFDARLRF